MRLHKRNSSLLLILLACAGAQVRGSAQLRPAAGRCGGRAAVGVSVPATVASHAPSYTWRMRTSGPLKP
jgi:hypothetical protein